MSHDPSRKRFLAKVLGLAAAGAVAPGAVARAVLPGAGGPAKAGPAFRLVAQPRAVARRPGSA